MKEVSRDLKPGSAGAWLLAIRPLTLPASIAPVLLGLGLAAREDAIALDLAIACLAVAASLQIVANLANDLFDGLSGVDSADRLGPRRATQSGLLRPRQVLFGLLVFLALGSAAGLYVVFQVGLWLLVLGGACIIGAIAYTAGPVPLSRLALGELAALIFFGPVACAGTFVVLAGSLTPAALIAGLIPGLHAAAIMAVNNLRDIDSDAKTGKRTLAVIIGERRARWLAAGLVLAGNLVALPLAAITGAPLVWLAALLLPASIPLVLRIHRTPRSPALNQVLARTGQWELATCLVLALLLNVA